MVSRICSTSASVSWATRRSAGMPTLSVISLAFAGPMPWMYWSGMTTRLLVGMLTPAMRATVHLHVGGLGEAAGLLSARPVEAGPCAVVVQAKKARDDFSRSLRDDPAFC